MKDLDLVELLKGHEGEEFYTTTHREVIYIGNEIEKKIDGNRWIIVKTKDGSTEFKILTTGQLYKNGEVIFYPSKKQKSWGKWIETNKLSNSPKTWNEVKDQNIYKFKICKDLIELETVASIETLIEKAAVALIKIHQLIEIGYGGYREDDINEDFYYISYYVTDKKFKIIRKKEAYYRDFFRLIHPALRFLTEQAAIEFQNYPSNIQLMKELFMIED